MNCYFLTFGCKVNTCETASMQTMLRSAGHCIVTTPEEADVCILNSCTVTESGDNRTRAALRKLRRSYPDMLLVLTGCYAQAYPEQAESIPEADLVLGTKGRSRLPELLETWQQTHTPCGAVDAYTGHDTFEALPCDIMPYNTRAFLKIQDGCNCFCSYCIIPYARGRCRSLPPEELRRAASTFAEHGYQELVLCGINLGFYGMEWGGSLADAVELCCTIPGIRRVRLSSLEPERMTDEVLDRLAALPQFCPQFHLSLQSGCDRTLRRMNRKYTAAEYAGICSRIRSRFPDCAITTDWMVGFPGESDADFEDAVRFAEKIRFAGIHVFRYSPRAGTRAAEFPEQISGSVKKARMEQAQSLAKASKFAFFKAQIGKTFPVLFERERGDGYHIGHAPNGAVIRVFAEKSKKSLRNRIFCVRIEENDADCCYGTLVAQDAADSAASPAALPNSR